MLRADYMSLLRKCNSNVFLSSPYPGFIGVCLNKPAVWDKVTTTNLTSDQIKIVKDLNSGHMIEAIVPLLPEMPEYSIYAGNTGNIGNTRNPGNRIARGYQDITDLLVKNGYINRYKAEKWLHYNGNADWHRASHKTRLIWQNTGR